MEKRKQNSFCYCSFFSQGFLTDNLCAQDQRFPCGFRVCLYQFYHIYQPEFFNDFYQLCSTLMKINLNCFYSISMDYLCKQINSKGHFYSKFYQKFHDSQAQLNLQKLLIYLIVQFKSFMVNHHNFLSVRQNHEQYWDLINSIYYAQILNLVS